MTPSLIARRMALLKEVQAIDQQLASETGAATEMQRVRGDMEVINRTSPRGMLAVNSEGVVLWIDEGAAAVLGSDIAAGQSLDLSQIVPSGGQEHVRSATYRVPTAGTNERFIFIHRQQRPGDGEILYVEDATARHHHVNALRRNDRRFRAMFENLPLSTLLYAPNGRLHGFNPAATLMWGVTQEQEAYLLNHYSAFEDEQNAALGLMEYFERCVAGDACDFGDIAYVASAVKSLEDQAMNATISHAYWFPIKDEDGTVVELGLFQEDLTKRRHAEQAKAKAEQATAEANRWLETTMDSIAEAVIAADNDGQITWLNQVATELTGWSVADALGRRLEDVYNTMAHDGTRRSPTERAARADGMRELTLVTKDGSLVLVSEHGAPIVAEGERLGSVMVFRDISEELQKEAALRQHQKLEALGTMAAGVAHEINNPLLGIMGFGELIALDLDDDSPLRPYADGIVSESRRISNIVRDLLSFSRKDIDAPEDEEVAEMVRATLSLTETALRKESIAVELRFSDDVPAVSCRRQAIQQVLLNLITNARDALNQRFDGADGDKRDKRDKRIRVSVSVSDDHVYLDVEDRGAGVEPEVLPRVFDPFFTTKSRARGTGLGLSVSLAIAEDHGGSLSLSNSDGGWTLARLTLPISS